MNDFGKRLLCLAAVVLLAEVVAIPVAANPQVNGSISFGGTPVFDNPSNIALATNLTALNDAKVLPGQQSGDYATIPDNQLVAFTPFVFVPATVPSSALWTLTWNGKIYEFFASTMTASYDADLAIWNFGGNGVARITGFAETAGTWNLAAGQVLSSYWFGSAAVVPEPSASALMLLSLACALGWRWRIGQSLEK
jgi:hypothetical protein